MEEPKGKEREQRLGSLTGRYNNLSVRSARVETIEMLIIGQSRHDQKKTKEVVRRRPWSSWTRISNFQET